MEVNGIAHIFLTASNFQRSREFYRQLLPFLGLKPVIDTETTYYCVGGRTAVGINAPGPNTRVPPSNKTASACTTSASAPASAPTSMNCTLPRHARRKNHPRAARGSMGAGILFAAVRGSRWDQARAQSCAGEGVAGVAVLSFAIVVPCERRGPNARWRSAIQRASAEPLARLRCFASRVRTLLRTGTTWNKPFDLIPFRLAEQPTLPRCLPLPAPSGMIAAR